MAPPAFWNNSNLWKWLTILLVLAVIGLEWKSCTERAYLHELKEWIDDHGGGDGTPVPPPPPKF